MTPCKTCGHDVEPGVVQFKNCRACREQNAQRRARIRAGAPTIERRGISATSGRNVSQHIHEGLVSDDDLAVLRSEYLAADPPAVHFVAARPRWSA